MVEFKGEISEEVKKDVLKMRKRKSGIFAIIWGVVALFLFIAVGIFDGNVFKAENVISAIFDNKIVATLLILALLFIVVGIINVFAPVGSVTLNEVWNHDIIIDQDKLIFKPSNFGERNIQSTRLTKVKDMGKYYYISCKGEKALIVCQKDLLVSGTLEEFTTLMDKKLKVGKQLSLEERNKVFKWGLIGIIASVALALLTRPFMSLAISAIDTIIPNTANYLFSHAVELFTFVFALIGTVFVTIFCVVSMVLIMPICALIALGFSIKQITVNRTWFSWLSLAVGVAGVVACVVQILTY